jgi:hypothetical protein
MYQLNQDDLQDMVELHKIFTTLINAAKEKYSPTILISALNVSLVDLIHEVSEDKEHFLTCKDKFNLIIDIEAKRFYE